MVPDMMIESRKPLFNKISSNVATHKKMLDIFRNMPKMGSMLRRTNSCFASYGSGTSGAAKTHDPR
jgi:hypothetical protein